MISLFSSSVLKLFVKVKRKGMGGGEEVRREGRVRRVRNIEDGKGKERSEGTPTPL